MRAKDWVIVYVEEHEEKEMALESERKIKKRGAKRFLQDNGDQSITL
jgi:predicted GIY-YIG superfamily endonuclease